MRMRDLLWIGGASLVLAGTPCITGCGSAAKTTGPAGDDTGEHLLTFVTTRVSGTAETDVVIWDADAGVFRSTSGLNATAGQSEPCIADDGSVVCFASPRTGGAGGSDVWVYDRLTQLTRNVTGLNSAANETWPRFTHDSKRIAFVRDSLGVKRIRLFDGTASALVALPGLDAPAGFNDDEPSPDLAGDGIAFQSDRSGATHVYVWTRTGGIAARPDLVSAATDADPSLTANGRWLAFASDRSGGAGGWDVYLYDLQSAAFVRLPGCNTAGDERHPSVSADGSVLFFEARASSSAPWGVWRYTLADSTRVQPGSLASVGTAADSEPCLRWR